MAACDVLVIDDQLEQCTLMQRLLSRVGYGVECATTGGEAIDFLRAHPTRLVMLDPAMPEMSGIDILRAIRSSPATHDIPVMVFSALALNAHREEAAVLGVRHYVTNGHAGFDAILAIIRHYIPAPDSPSPHSRLPAPP